ncbi:MAG TPA: uridine diphosphate-N-acetylglucosamine-binding protein YvcK, partial [Acidimicrobiia bacterium]|nr:uridine diphosphate-N-acetylglucosamine-binding protein YvcK [Acidimicrobiia bacterium]
MPSNPHAKIVALGGGHGLAVALQAVRRYAQSVTAVVSVADDGGSSGRLRRDLGVAAPGDLRKSLVALAADTGPWPAAFEHRFAGGELSGHALGNLLIVGLAASLGDLNRALDEAGRLLGAVGRVVPATVDAVTLEADIGDEAVIGQVAVESLAAGVVVNQVRVVPADAAATPDALDAIADATQVVLAPGSLYTSVLAVLCVPEIR